MDLKEKQGYAKFVIDFTSDKEKFGDVEMKKKTREIRTKLLNKLREL